MSASREKKFRQDQTGSDLTGPKTAREAEERKAEKRSNLLYGIIAVAFVVLAVIAIVWRSNVIPKSAAALTIDDQKYTANEVTFYYKNTLQGFLQNSYQYLSLFGVDMNSPLEDQVIPEQAASLFGAEAGETWKDFIMDQAVDQMTAMQAVLKTAEKEGFTYPDSVQAQYDSAMESLHKSAEASGVSVGKYLQNMLGRSMTEKVYGEQLMRMLKYDAYCNAHRDSLTYTDEDIDAAYAKDTNAFDRVSFESVTFPASPETKTDADGKPVEPTEAETAEAKKAAKSAADQMLADFQAGGNLKDLAEAVETASYSEENSGEYAEGSAVSEWLFKDGMQNGNSAVLEDGGSYVLVVFHNRFREETNSINVRHILIAPEEGTLTEDQDGYKEEQDKLKADAKAKAEDILKQWKDGEATEDSFAALAKENSADSSTANGGLYTQVLPGDMVPAFNDWCFDSARQPGDTGVVETEYGSHVMYFVDQDIPVWKVHVTNSLKTNDYNEWFKQFTEEVPTETHSFGMKFVG